MEKVWYSVLFFIIIINQVFAIDRNCSSLDSISSCDECIRCHGYWCNNPNPEESRCAVVRNDNWCVDHRETDSFISGDEVPGKFFRHKYRAKTVRSGTDEYKVTFPSKTNPKMTLYSNSTQEPVVLFNTTDCKDGVCTVTIESQVDTGFCRKDGRVDEFYTIVLKVEGSDEEVVMKNHVPCACECSSNVELRSSKCSGRGNFSCGICDCEDGWHSDTCEQQDSVSGAGTGGATGTTAGTDSSGYKCNDHGVWREGKCHCNEPWHGDFCQQRDMKMDYGCKGHGIWSDGKCHCHGHWSGEFCDTCSTRGDITVCNRNDDVGECSGHGTCECGCVCFNNTIGSRYFDHNNYCEDLCMAISSDCDICAFTSKPGRCDVCKFPLTRQPYVESRLEERDELNRDMWVRCNDTLDDCTVEYAAMRDDAGDTFIMIIKSCDPVNNANTGMVAVSILLGVLLPLVAILAAGAFYLWKNRTPPLPLTDPMYQNIDAEDCTGENPLYKPPTSSFKNPTYGKWQ